MIKELVRDQALLSQPAKPATAEDAALAKDLLDTLASLEHAGCLAANQIGALKAICVYSDERNEPHVMFNPRLLFGLGASKMREECLTKSEPVTVTRYAKVKIQFDELADGALKTRKRDFTGYTAQMIQHMIDHCRGRLV
ncbi:formylmethionine deformylase [Coriobacterium glomerans PW2]|uniref:Formylmethionine deformylase n=1 Tax=Coriobacterium glomerans (strain ATCC 49209 / DSM 20642 / JCM 10262 / PW2) TaxID=700015 RepID=F2NBG3_CORGP|nr:peptide deformylase [Coriobacterium glomerans]AEB06699.1 formylmethionine deformylase [Coriobacterium glomerans PW2]